MMRLGILLVEDKMQKNDPEITYLASSIADADGSHTFARQPTDLVRIFISAIQRDSPEYRNIDQAIDMQFNTLDIMCNRETVVTLVHVLAYIFIDDLESTEPDFSD